MFYPAAVLDLWFAKQDESQNALIKPVNSGHWSLLKRNENGHCGNAMALELRDKTRGFALWSRALQEVTVCKTTLWFFQSLDHSQVPFLFNIVQRLKSSWSPIDWFVQPFSQFLLRSSTWMRKTTFCFCLDSNLNINVITSWDCFWCSYFLCCSHHLPDNSALRAQYQLWSGRWENKQTNKQTNKQQNTGKQLELVLYLKPLRLYHAGQF